jgi:hypothetical protein
VSSWQRERGIYIGAGLAEDVCITKSSCLAEDLCANQKDMRFAKDVCANQGSGLAEDACANHEKGMRKPKRSAHHG